MSGGAVSSAAAATPAPAPSRAAHCLVWVVALRRMALRWRSRARARRARVWQAMRFQSLVYERQFEKALALAESVGGAAGLACDGTPPLPDATFVSAVYQWTKAPA